MVMESLRLLWLVIKFGLALYKKLLVAEQRYSWQGAWRNFKPSEQDWINRGLQVHLIKGDPRDVAIYCAFLWYHNRSIIVQPSNYVVARDNTINSLDQRSIVYRVRQLLLGWTLTQQQSKELIDSINMCTTPFIEDVKCPIDGYTMRRTCHDEQDHPEPGYVCNVCGYYLKDK